VSILLILLSLAAPSQIVSPTTQMPNGPSATSDSATDIVCQPIASYRADTHLIAVTGTNLRQCSADNDYLRATCQPVVTTGLSKAEWFGIGVGVATVISTAVFIFLWRAR